MKSDIILDDKNVEIIARNLEITSFGRKGLTYQDSKLTLGNSERDGNSARLLVTDGKEKTDIRSRYISSDLLIGDRIRAKELNAQEIEIGPTASDSPKTSKLIVNNKQAEAAITIDGEKEDIFLKHIGSLTEKIRELETEISGIKNYLQNL